MHEKHIHAYTLTVIFLKIKNKTNTQQSFAVEYQVSQDISE